MITGEYYGPFCGGALQQVIVLMDGIRRSLVPLVAMTHLRRNRCDVFTELRVEDRPAVTQMLVQ